MTSSSLQSVSQSFQDPDLVFDWHPTVRYDVLESISYDRNENKINLIFKTKDYASEFFEAASFSIYFSTANVKDHTITYECPNKDNSDALWQQILENVANVDTVIAVCYPTKS